jgi:peptidoglycan/xylan/chitin deacetylase (PgdA/CDA1 family)
MPELLARSIHSTIFVPTNFFGRGPRWITKDNERISADVVMTVEQLKEFPTNLVTLGSHSSTHVLLTQTERERAWDEIEGSRRELERLTGRKIRLFAFPYGDHDPSTVELCKLAGYEQAFTMLPNPVETESTSILRGRVEVDPIDWPIEFFLKFSGAYAWMTWWIMFKHSVLRRRQNAIFERSVRSSILP